MGFSCLAEKKESVRRIIGVSSVLFSEMNV